ncbi:protein mono-ADP-ribosyltransferase PARP9 isoform X2 [Amia ocellicauda]|uniref:protein mono-ADP-ribosyltransferase PARP9 isoform X2 n=1 Tax=Amia ocellicauda TaxID=2972642 RepID=UPI0034641BB1
MATEGLEIPITPEIGQTLSQHQNLNPVVQRRFGCRAALRNVEGTGGSSWSSSNGSFKAEERYSVTLVKGLKISVWKDDLTRHQVEAVVNAANARLDHCGGLAEALSKAGGPEIQENSNHLISKNGCIATGDAVVTTAGKLPCQKIIHAVGPRCRPHPDQEDIKKASGLLEKAVNSILKKAEEQRFKSVAIPALSSGIFNFPLPRCAEVIVSTLKKYHDNQYSKARGLEIHLVNNDEPSVCAMEKACKEILIPSKSYSQAAGSPSTSVQIGNVTLHVKQGRIEKEKADVIVNTVGTDLKLSLGNISNSILKSAGYELQKALYQYQNTPVYGSVFKTEGFYLDCKAVYHTICCYYRDRNASKILETIMFNCLIMAAGEHMRSIAFPAIGTGNLGFPRDEVARIMIGQCFNFAYNFQGKKLDVHFVIFPGDKENRKAFEKTLSDFQNTGNPKGYRGAEGRSAAQSRDLQWPSIVLSDGSHEGQMEAKKWITNTLLQERETLTIDNNSVFFFGQREHDELLSFQTIHRVTIKVMISNGKASLRIVGPPRGVVAAALAVELLCCQVQEEFATCEEIEMLQSLVQWHCNALPELAEPENNATLEKAYWAEHTSKTINVKGSTVNVLFRDKKVVDHLGKRHDIERRCLLNVDYTKFGKGSDASFHKRTPENRAGHSKRTKLFNEAGLEIVTIEKIDNPLLEGHFQVKRNFLSAKPETMYQSVPAQFCDLVCRAGFHRLYSQPREEKFGAGIYFCRKPPTLSYQEDPFGADEFIYIFEAQVLTGKSTNGSPGLIVPPVLGTDPLILYDSVTGGTHTAVIFNSRQAYPEYLITCRRVRGKTTV